MITSFLSGGKATEFGKNPVGFAPLHPLFRDRREEIVECREILIMSSALAQEFSHARDRVEFGTIMRWHCRTPRRTSNRLARW